jgi:hypothetical protein
MKLVDRWLQQLRIDRALPWVPGDSHALDVGCADGALFVRGRDRIRSGVGVDVEPTETWPAGPYERRMGRLTELIDDETFDAVIMLAVVEHASPEELEEWATLLPSALRVGGRLIITTPSPMVDRILDWGIRLKLLDGMEADQHHGFDPETTPGIFASPALRLCHHQRFELGLNYLFVFDRVASGQGKP